MPDCVLIVDDEEAVRESLRDVVEMVAAALTAASSEEALALVSDTELGVADSDVLWDRYALVSARGPTVSRRRFDTRA